MSSINEPAEIGVAAGALLRERYRARYNVAPGQDHLILCMQREERKLLGARWGLINAWAEDGKRAFQQINARGPSSQAARRSGAR